MSVVDAKQELPDTQQHDVCGMLSVVLASSDRTNELERCVASLLYIDVLVAEIIVLVNAPSTPWSDSFYARLKQLSGKISFVHSSRRLSCAESRNLLGSFATAPYLLILDDDAYLLNSTAIELGVGILQARPNVGALAFAQCDANGKLPEGVLQPAPRGQCCLTCAFAGYGNVVRTKVFKALGGFQNILEVYGEENEMCRRVWAEGFSVVWIPEKSICHEPSQINRDESRQAALTARNRLLDACLNEPWYVLPLTVPIHIFNAIRFLASFRRHHRISMVAVSLHAFLSFLAAFPATWKQRRPIALKHHLRWERIKRQYPLFTAQVAPMSLSNGSFDCG